MADKNIGKNIKLDGDLLVKLKTLDKLWELYITAHSDLWTSFYEQHPEYSDYHLFANSDEGVAIIKYKKKDD